MADRGAREPDVPIAGRSILRVSSTCVIRLDELEWLTTGSGGPGGQHANTSDTSVEARFAVETASSLAPRQRARLLEQVGPVVRARASDSRSQARNRDLALERLRSRLEVALRVDPPRRSTKPTKSARQARLDAKHKQSERKQHRRRPSRDD